MQKKPGRGKSWNVIHMRGHVQIHWAIGVVQVMVVAKLLRRMGVPHSQWIPISVSNAL
ncbi:MAG: hypothetical protein HOC71_05125 [Candidatus Latescibacteria bacterium]|nr:hypothetical protein [Candidatus Latescibacterota bacterium]